MNIVYKTLVGLICQKKYVPKCLYPSLNKVKIKKYVISKNEFTLIEYFFKYAKIYTRPRETIQIQRSLRRTYDYFNLKSQLPIITHYSCQMLSLKQRRSQLQTKFSFKFYVLNLFYFNYIMKKNLF